MVYYGSVLQSVEWIDLETYRVQLSIAGQRSWRHIHFKPIGKSGNCVRDYTGQRFGKFVVVAEVGRDARRNVLFCCQCDCGNKVIVPGFRLKAGKRHCGCGKKPPIDASRTSKWCPRCKSMKSIEEFGIHKHHKDGHRGYCKLCQRKIDRECSPVYRPTKTAYKARKYKNDLSFRLACLLRARITKVMNGGKRCSSVKYLLGCSVQQLKTHLEEQFEPGMTWENHSRSGWHIDHIRPCASFDLTDPEQQKQCFHYTNLQPLWAADNFHKSGSWKPKS